MILLCSLILMNSCTKPYDDSAMLEKLEALELRTAKLEDLCKRLNSNVVALKSLVAAYDEKDRVSSVEEIRENGILKGYTVNFCFSEPVNIYCGIDGLDGEDGRDAMVPMVGVTEVDGVRCWTIDGEPVKDTDGNPIPLIYSEDGEAVEGITPQIRTEKDGTLSYSIDKGQTWNRLDVSVKWGNGNIFTSVKSEGNDFVFNLADGSEIVFPKTVGFTLTLAYAGENLTDGSVISASAGSTVELSYNVTCDEKGEVEVDAFAQGSLTATASDGKITVTIPVGAGDSQVTVFATSPSGTSIMTTFKINVQ